MYEFVGKKGQTYKIKLNYNCPADQKSGEGKGSCGGSDNKSSDKFDEILKTQDSLFWLKN